MAEWLVELGIGETRAALVDGGRIVEARIERDDEPLRAGAIVDARVGAVLPDGTRTAVRVGRVEAILRGRADVPEGGTVRATVLRETIPESGNPKPPQLGPVDREASLMPGPSLLERCRASGVPIALLDHHGPDRLEAAGWSEAIEAARTGVVPFDGGLLRIALTPAMTVIDVDGSRPPATLAVTGAEASARAIQLLDIAGSVGVDLPTSGDKATRIAAAAALDRLLPRPFERTAVNGFGFVQIVRPRIRASLLELVQADRAGHAARALLRRAAREPPGAATLVAHAQVIARLERRPDWLDALARLRGGAVTLRRQDQLAISSGDVDRSR